MEDKQPRNRSKTTTFALLGMTIFSGLLLLFAYTQRLDAKRQRELSIHLKEELIRMEKIAVQNQKEAMTQKVLAEESQRMAQKALEECKQNQKSK